MKPEFTLCDELYRATFAKSDRIFFVDRDRLDKLRASLTDARKFVLDDAMSAFLVDLSSAAFMGKSKRLVHRLADQMRELSRLPHRLIWIEYNFHAAQERALALGLGSPFEEKGSPPRCRRQGWLINEHPTNETHFRVHMFEDISLGLMAFPFAYGWLADDQVGPWTKPDKAATYPQSEIATGIVGYYNDRCGVLQSEFFDDYEAMLARSRLVIDPLTGSKTGPKEVMTEFLRLSSATLRRVWALLATVNDVPIGLHEVTASKGFVARGRYRRFLDHSIITLKVPATADKRKIARILVAASRRRAHQVRGHWRRDWRHPGQRLWIHEHERGDASLGFVTHDYSVEHPTTDEEKPNA